VDVRFGSKADMCGAAAYVRFAPNSDCESGHLPTDDHQGQSVQSSSPVCFAPESGRVQCS